VVPSYIESFGQTASESQACGTPVVGFDSSGLNEIIDHKKTGYLASSYDISDLKNGILWVLGQVNQSELRVNCRKKVIENFSYEIIGKKYLNLYNDIISQNSK
jgi:glycosyltransferase involved in cell wall biosynthesis